MRQRKKINVAITGLGGGGYGMEILKALKLSSLPYRFVGMDITRMSYGLRVVDKSYVVPPAGHPDYLKTLLNIIKKNNIHALFHGSDKELAVIRPVRDQLNALGVFFPANTEDVLDVCMDKLKLNLFLRSKGYKVPATFFISELGDVKKVLCYPVVCKPHSGASGSSNVFIAQTETELRQITGYLLQYLESFIVQEYIGDSLSEYTVGVLNDMDGNLIDSIAVKRLLTGLSRRISVPNKTGKVQFGADLVVSSGISQGEIGRFRGVSLFCEKVAASLGSRGPLNIQCRMHNGDVYIFEINPRFSGTTSFRAMAGFNEPDILVRRYVLGLGLPAGRVKYKRGMILRALQEEFMPLR